jgi:hypothetical protein
MWTVTVRGIIGFLSHQGCGQPNTHDEGSKVSFHLSLSEKGFRDTRVNSFIEPTNPNISPGNAMIVPGLSFRCGFAIESIAIY